MNLLKIILSLSEEHDITLHGQANRRDLSDADDRFFLRTEVAHACRSSDDTSRRLRDALEDRAREGRPHFSGQRPYGYAPDAVTVIEPEAVIVRKVYARYLEGASPGLITRELNDRGEVTVNGKPWQPYAVRSVLASRHVTGIRVFRGQEAGEGDRASIIDRGTWQEVQEQRSYRSSAYDRRGWRFHLLRGLVVCKRYGWRMAGSTSKDVSYMCARHTYLGAERCHRRIGAARLEEFVTDAAVESLTRLDVSGAPSAATALSAADETLISADEAELAELKDMWTSRELSTREYREMRKTIEDRISTVGRTTIVRPTVEVLAGLVGPDARAAWDRLAAGGEVERLNSVLRFLFAEVIMRAPGPAGHVRLQPHRDRTQPPLRGARQPVTVTPAPVTTSSR